MQSYSTIPSKDDYQEYKILPIIFQLIENMTTHLSAVLSSCGYNNSGCHTFGKNLADEFKSDHLGVATLDGVDFFKQPINLSQAYQYIIFTGCLITDSSILVQARKKYDFSNLKHTYIITTPWVVPDYDLLYKDLSKEYSKHNFNVTLLTSGIGGNLSNCIGLPSPFPILSNTEPKEVFPENCYGLMYIRDLLSDPFIFFVLRTEDGKPFPRNDKDVKFLSTYFSQISRIANSDKDKSEFSPSVTVITTDSDEKKLVSEVAGKFKVSVNFVNRLSAENFIDELKSISKKGGIIACNGSHTLIQAIILDCNFMFFPSKRCNNSIVNQLLNLIPLDLKEIAKVILGLLNDVDLLSDSTKVERIYKIIGLFLKESMLKFERAKSQCMLKPTIGILEDKKILLASKQHTDTKFEKSAQSTQPTSQSFISPAIKLKFALWNLPPPQLQSDVLESNTLAAQPSNLITANKHGTSNST